MKLQQSAGGGSGPRGEWKVRCVRTAAPEEKAGRGVLSFVTLGTHFEFCRGS